MKSRPKRRTKTKRGERTGKGSMHDKAPQSPQESAPSDQPEEKKPFDYGGLPDRDLKKNLGCG